MCVCSLLIAAMETNEFSELLSKNVNTQIQIKQGKQQTLQYL